MPPLFRANADSRTNTKFLRQLSGQAPRRREVSKAEEFFAQNQVFPLDKIQEPQNALSRPIGRRFWNQGLSGFGGSGSERWREAGADDGRASGHCRAREQRAREGGVAQTCNKRGRSKQQGLHCCDDVDDVPPKCCATHSIQRRCTSRWCTGSAALWPGSG